MRVSANIDADIGECVFGWEVDRDVNRYKPPDGSGGSLLELPDFRSPRGNALLRGELEKQGWKINIDYHPVDFEKKVGKRSTARLRRSDAVVECTEETEEEAVCMAALKSCGRSVD